MSRQKPATSEADLDDSEEQGSSEEKQTSEEPPSKWSELVRKKLFEPLALSDNPPWVDARGVALGIFVALGIPVGGHTLTLGLLRLFFRYNIVVAFGFSWILNPFTVLPLYYGYYYLGSLVLGGDTIMGMHGFEQAMDPIIHSKHFVEALKQFALLDLVILERWAVTAVVVSTSSAFLGYVVSHRILTKRRALRTASFESSNG
jgi:uncharacterized protein (DUF2062 family)